MGVPVLETFSVIVTAHNMAGVVARTLRSVEASVHFLNGRWETDRPPRGEIVVIDDGSQDQTWQAIHEFVAGRPDWVTLRNSKSTSPSSARNRGVQASSGELLFFLDGDDLFYPEHVYASLQAMQSPAAAFVKTGVHIADPIHESWVKPIAASVVINLCVRRQCHDTVGGFPDFVLCQRFNDHLHPVTDIFFKFEDMYYNQLIANLFPGVAVNRETVENLRYPGNSFDRQYEKFKLPYGTYREPHTEADNFRLQLCDAIIAHRLNELRTKHSADERGLLRDGR